MTTTLIGDKNFKFKHLAGLISGIFYMLNPYFAINIMPLRQVSYTIYALLPLFLGIFIKGLNEKRNIKFAMVAAFVMLLSTSVYVDPSFIP
jgi:ABC-type nitrate/sulfonate/bicarbonate transport system permease component